MGSFDGPHRVWGILTARTARRPASRCVYAAAYGNNNELFRFDVAAGQMAALSPAGTEAVPALANMGLAVAADGRVYVYGGHDGSTGACPRAESLADTHARTHAHQPIPKPERVRGTDRKWAQQKVSKGLAAGSSVLCSTGTERRPPSGPASCSQL